MPDHSVLPDQFSERDNEVIQFIIAEKLSGFTFDGIRRRLGVHPETLSRILFRLEEMNLIVRAQVGYKVTSIANEMTIIPLSENTTKIQVLQTYLPMNSAIESLLSEIEGKWFSSLRWLGYSKNDDSTTFKWITSDSKAQIDAFFWDNSLNIEVTLLEEDNLDMVITSSHYLLGFITKTIQNLNHFPDESFI